MRCWQGDKRTTGEIFQETILSGNYTVAADKIVPMKYKKELKKLKDVDFVEVIHETKKEHSSFLKNSVTTRSILL